MLFKPEIKICGLTSEEEVEWVVKERADYAGFVLYFPKSKRNLTPEQAGRLLQTLKKCREEETALSAADGKKDAAGSFPADKKTNVMNIPRSVAVVVSPTPVQVREIKKLGFDYIQIHGTISEETLSELTLPVIRAVNVRSGGTADEEGVLPAEEYIRYVKKQAGFEREQLGERLFACLFDAAEPGSGQVFDWELLSRMRLPEVKIFLAGGLNGENVRAAVRAVMPDVVDVSSGVELSPETIGKDYAKIKEFVRKVRTDE